MSGGFDVEQFVETPDMDLICVICRSVLRCPVRASCKHVFCKRCILQWMKRQETCPCCRKQIQQSEMLVMFKLKRTIGRLLIKCGNKQQGCRAIFPLSDEHMHMFSCPYARELCPYEGCGEFVLRKDVQTHDQSCIHWKQLCPMGCGTMLNRENQARHNCYRDLQQRYVAEQRRQRAIAANLRRKMLRMQSRMAQIKRQVNQLCESLEINDLDIEAGEGTSAGTSSNTSRTATGPSRSRHRNSRSNSSS